MLRWLSVRSMWSALLVAAVSSYFQGCASQSLAPSAIRTVSVEKRSQMPKQNQIVFNSTGQSAAVIASTIAGGIVGGAIAAGVSAGATADERSAIRMRLHETGTDPGLVIAQAWERELVKEQFYPVVPSGGDAVFKVEVLTVGLTGGGRKFHPVMLGRAELVRRDGRVLWDDEELVSGTDDRIVMPGRPFDEYMRDPGLLRARLTQLSELFSRDLLSRFRDEYRGGLQDDADLRRDAEDREWAKLSKAERRLRERQRDLEEERQELELDAQERAREQSEEQEVRRAKAERRRLQQQARARR